MRPICCITGGKAGRVPGLPAALRPRRPEHGDCDHGGRQLPGPVRRMVCPSRQTKEHDSLISIICSSYRAFRIRIKPDLFFCPPNADPHRLQFGKQFIRSFQVNSQEMSFLLPFWIQIRILLVIETP